MNYKPKHAITSRIEKTGVEIMRAHIRTAQKSRWDDYYTLTVKDMKKALKMNGVKGYSKWNKKRCIQELMKL